MTPYLNLAQFIFGILIVFAYMYSCMISVHSFITIVFSS